MNLRGHLVLSVCSVGLLLAADTVFLLYLARSLFYSESAIISTGVFLLVQEAMLFGFAVYVAICAGRTTALLPIYAGYITVLASCSSFAVLVIVLFNALLWFGLVSIQTFWVALAMRQATVMILLICVHVVGLVQRAAFRAGELSRERVQCLADACAKMAVQLRLSGSSAAQAAEQTLEVIRFSERLRNDSQLCFEIESRIDVIQQQARSSDTSLAAADECSRLLREILILSGRGEEMAR